MTFSRSIAVGVALVLPLATISAQSDSVSSSGIEPAKWEFSLGADPTNLNLSPNYPMRGHFVGTLTRNWQSPASRFSRQLSLMFGADLPHNARPSCLGCSNKEYAALTAGVAADLFHAWRFTPYLHSGAGLYYEHVGFASPYLPNGLGATPNRNDFSLGINGGFGVKARLFSHELFIDQTLHAFDVRRINHGVYPLSIGIRW